MNSVREACLKLQVAIRRGTHLRAAQPFIVLAFDEAHKLSCLGRLVDLQSSLCAIGSGVFSVFLTTDVEITLATLPHRVDPSHLASPGAHSSTPPFTSLGWDPIARALPEDVQVGNIGFGYQVYLGRPL